MRFLRSPDRQVLGTISGAVFVLLPALALARTASAATFPSPASTGQPPTTALVFYAHPQADEDMWPLLFQTLLHDLSSGGGELPNGLELEKEPAILRGNEDLRGISFTRIISVRLLGRCDRIPQGASGTGPLGWVMLVSGKIQPYVFIDCTRIAQLLGPVTTRMSKQGRQHAMAEAISRVLIHEWIHIVTQSSSHTARGLTQAYLSVDDLIAAPTNSRLSASAGR
jgi:hypothetical protein